MGLVLSSTFWAPSSVFWAVLLAAFFVPFLVALPAFLAAFLVSRPASLASCLAVVSSWDWAPLAVRAPMEPKSKRVRDAKIARDFMGPPLRSEGRVSKSGEVADSVRAVFFGGRWCRGEEVDSRQLKVESETARATATCCGSIVRTWGAAVLRPYKAIRWLGGAGFVCVYLIDEVAEVAFGVAAFRGLFVEFELRSQAAQEFCCFEHDEEILSGEGEATNRTLVLGRNLRNICDFFAWRVYQKR